MTMFSYHKGMEKAQIMHQPDGKLLVLDPTTDTYVEVPGAGSMRETSFKLDKRIDLTRPIYEQVVALGSRNPRETLKNT